MEEKRQNRVFLSSASHHHHPPPPPSLTPDLFFDSSYARGWCFFSIIFSRTASRAARGRRGGGGDASHSRARETHAEARTRGVGCEAIIASTNSLKYADHDGGALLCDFERRFLNLVKKNVGNTFSQPPIFCFSRLIVVCLLPSRGPAARPRWYARPRAARARPVRACPVAPSPTRAPAASLAA